MTLLGLDHTERGMLLTKRYESFELWKGGRKIATFIDVADAWEQRGASGVVIRVEQSVVRAYKPRNM